MDAVGGVWLTHPLVALAFGLGVFVLVGYAHAGVVAQAQRAEMCDELLLAVRVAARSEARLRPRGARRVEARSSAAGRPYTTARRHARRRAAV